MNKRCILLVLDSLGVGALPDAETYGDLGCDTLGHICEHRKLEIPHLEALGLGCIRPLAHIRCVAEPHAFYGKMIESSKGKDSTTGHWEIAGVIVEEPFRTFPDGFPAELIKQLEERTGLDFIGNRPESGTVIIKQLGQQHQSTGNPIIYTSSDPVLQIAAHQEVIPVERLYELCRIAFELATPLGINRVIARPFIGEYPNYTRTHHRQDFSIEPPLPTVLNRLSQAGIPVVSIGKVAQLFSGQGISESTLTKGNDNGIEVLLKTLHELPRGLVFSTLIDFDMLYGHRRDVEGYANAIERFDCRLPELLDALDDNDILMITADHGNDPTFKGSDHTREYVPLLVYQPQAESGGDLGTRATFADIAATVANYFDVTWKGPGSSFLEELRP